MFVAPNIATKTDADEPKKESSKSKRASSRTHRRTKSSELLNVWTKINGDKDKDEEEIERPKSRILASQQRARRNSMSSVLVDAPNIVTKRDGDEPEKESQKIKAGSSRTVRRTKSSEQLNVSAKIGGDRDEAKIEHSKSRIASQQRSRWNSMSSVVDAPNIVTKANGDEAKRESSKSKKASSTTLRRTKSSELINVSTKTGGDRDRANPKSERSRSRIASQHRRRRTCDLSEHSFQKLDCPDSPEYSSQNHSSTMRSPKPRSSGAFKGDRKATSYRSKMEKSSEQVVPPATPYRSKTEERPKQVVTTVTPYRTKTEKRPEQVAPTATPYHSKTEPAGTGLAAKSPKPKMVKDGDDNACGASSLSRAPRTSNRSKRRIPLPLPRRPKCLPMC